MSSEVQSMPQPTTLTPSSGPAPGRNGPLIVPFATAVVTTSSKSADVMTSQPLPVRVTPSVSPISSSSPNTVPPANPINSISINNNNQGNMSNAVSLLGNNNQTDYFRNCNVPNLINKWRRRHTWLFLKEGKMFCQVIYYN